jgi:hypothetical protein
MTRTPKRPRDPTCRSGFVVCLPVRARVQGGQRAVMSVFKGSGRKIPPGYFRPG